MGAGVAHVMSGVALLTVKVTDALAEEKYAVEAWKALKTTVPVPVIVTVEPDIVAGPDTTL